MLSNIPVALEVATKRIPNSLDVPFYDLLVQEHVLDLKDGNFLPNLHNITELSRAIYLFSEKCHTTHTIVVCT